MDLKKLGGLENLNPNKTSGVNGGSKSDPAASAMFKETLKAFDQRDMQPGVTTSLNGQSPLANLQSLAKPPASVTTNSLKFSNHAIERMQSRGVFFNQDEIGKIQEAVGRAASKGSKDSLILTDKAALIVSVKNNTVVTVMDKSALKENVFTNIDSTIVM